MMPGEPIGDEELEALVQGLRGEPPPEEAPAWPAPPVRRIWPAAGLVLAVACGLLLWLGLPGVPTDDPLQHRGARAPAEIDLRLLLERDGVLSRPRPGACCRVGDVIRFQLAGTGAETFYLWMLRPDGVVEPIAAVSASAVPVEVRDERGVLAYELEQPGVHTLSVSTVGHGRCPDGRCQQRTLGVQ